jgi:hypothetical protein
MKDCNTCIIGITLLLSSIYMSILKQDQDIFIHFFRLLNEDQQQIYTNIVKERLMIYFTGMLTGLVFALLYYYKYPKQSYPICTFLAIVYVTKLSIYYFYPKSPLMLYSLTTKEQTDAWANIYEEMKKRYKISLLVGFIGYLVLFNGLK